MTTTAHTKLSPWRAEWTHTESNIKKGWHVITSQYEDVISIPNAREAEANAKLIAAAPEMFEALKKVTDIMKVYSIEPEDFAVLKQCMMAIKKAQP